MGLWPLQHGGELMVWVDERSPLRYRIPILATATNKSKSKSGKGSKGPSKKPTKADIPVVDVIYIQQLKAILKRASSGEPIPAEEVKQLESVVDTLAFLTQELEAKGASIKRLRKLIFGTSTSEKTSTVLGAAAEASAQTEHDATTASDTSVPGPEPVGNAGKGDVDASETTASTESDVSTEDKPKPKGHGRNGASTYKGADKVPVPHDSLKPGDRCPECQQGKVYRQEPSRLVRVSGMAPLNALVYELERFRCNLCGTYFVAEAPPEVGNQKYDESAKGMIVMLKYGTGMPFNRLESLQNALDIPLPSSTQWEEVEEAAEVLAPIYEVLQTHAAAGDILHNDDTGALVLDLEKVYLDENGKERTGIFTTGIVSIKDTLKTALFKTGHKHAGENLEDLLKRRPASLPTPIQMCDALATNWSGEFKTILANCITHARRNYVDVVESFPEQVRYVIEKLRVVYKNDAFTKTEGMSSQERLEYHQKHSGPLMEDLEKWLQQQFDEKLVEPNSALGKAIKYMQRHWKKLTQFLQVAGAPLDNNIVERALKKAILHRKNAYFYKTEHGAWVGDLFMSFIHTCELNDVNPFDYLVAVLRHPKEVAESPEQWLPWNYTANLSSG